MDFARKIQPFRSTDHFQQIADALNCAREAQNCSVSAYKHVPMIAERGGRLRQSAESTYYVDAINGIKRQ